MARFESNMDKLLAARHCLRNNLEKSKSLASHIDQSSSTLQKTNEKLLLFSTELRSTHSRKSTLSAVGEHVDRAFGPVSAVLKIYDSVRGLESLLKAGPTGGDIMGYLSAVKQLEEALLFLSNNCGLAAQWMEDIVKLLDEDIMDDDKYMFNLKKSLRVLSELKATQATARVNGGLLSNAFNRLELVFRQMVKTNATGESQFSEPVAQTLEAIIERLKANDRLENCKTIFVDVRGSNARAALEALDLSYLEVEISESVSIQKFEDHTVQWGKHIEFAVKHVLRPENELCKSLFEKLGSEIYHGCFAKITVESGFLGLLEFGTRVTEAKKDAVKLLKLLDIFAILNNLRSDFNTLFGSKACVEIQNLTRALIKRVVDGACEIFKELSVQVEAQRNNTMLPSDGSVPRLVTFVVNYCVMLLEDSNKPVLSQVLSIHQIWNKKIPQNNGILREEFLNILNSLEVNLQEWSKTFEETTLSNFFLMNNYVYLYELLQGTAFGDLMGEKLLADYKNKLQNYAQTYLKHSWGKLPTILNEDDLVLFSFGSTQEAVKKRFREFNEAFEEIYKKQSKWVMMDYALREKACQLIVHAVVPNYRSFVHNYGYLVENGSSPGKYVKYSASNLEAMLSGLFQPNIAKFGHSNSSKSNHLVGKLRNAVANQFRVAPITT